MGSNAHASDDVRRLTARAPNPLATRPAWRSKGFLSRQLVDDFVYFADTAFNAFGDRVKKWIT